MWRPLFRLGLVFLAGGLSYSAIAHTFPLDHLIATLTPQEVVLDAFNFEAKSGRGRVSWAAELPSCFLPGSGTASAFERATYMSCDVHGLTYGRVVDIEAMNIRGYAVRLGKLPICNPILAVSGVVLGSGGNPVSTVVMAVAADDKRLGSRLETLLDDSKRLSRTEFVRRFATDPDAIDHATQYFDDPGVAIETLDCSGYAVVRVEFRHQTARGRVMAEASLETLQ